MGRTRTRTMSKGGSSVMNRGRSMVRRTRNRDLIREQGQEQGWSWLGARTGTKA